MEPLPGEVEELLSWLAAEKGRSPNTLAAYRRDLAFYATFLADRGLAPVEVTEDVVEAYVAFLRAAGRAPSSVARALVSVRALHRFLAEGGRATGNPAGHVGPPRVPAEAPRILTEQEVSTLLGAVVGDHSVARRDRAILEVLYGGGLRVSELVGLGLDDVDLRAGLLRGVGPGSRRRDVPVGQSAADALAAWLTPAGRGSLTPGRWARKGDAEAVFLNARGGRLSRQGAWRIVHLHGDTVGLAGTLTPHVLRHSCAAHMLDHGADPRVVEELLGHVPAITAGPARLSTQRLQRDHAAAHPRAFGAKPH
ncbi:MAG: tyrosine-type recombinase/integrase [Acidimicrobiales bacterium]